MEDQFPKRGTFVATNIQSAKTLAVFLLLVLTVTRSHTFHLPAHHSNSTNGNATDSNDSHHGFSEDSQRGNSTENYQYGRLASNSNGDTNTTIQDVQKDNYKNDTVHVVPRIAKYPNTPDSTGNIEAKSENQTMSGKIEAEIVGSDQEEAKELSQHNLKIELLSPLHSQKKENPPDKGPVIVTYKSDIQKKEQGTSTKLLTLEQRIAAYLYQHKNRYLHNSLEDTKSDEKKEVIVHQLPTKMGHPEKHDENTQISVLGKNIDGADLKAQKYGHKFQEDVKDIVNTKTVHKYNLYDDIGQDDIRKDHTVRDDTGKGDIIKADMRKDHTAKDDTEKGDIMKADIRKENVTNKDKNDDSTNNGKDGNVKNDNKVYDYYYDSDRRQGSTRPHYDYDDKGDVTEDAHFDKEDKHKNKETLKAKPGEKLRHENDIFHEPGSFHTVENFVEENLHSQKHQLARRKSKSESRHSNQDNKEVAVSAFKARVTRGDDENDDKKPVGVTDSTNTDQQSGFDHNNPTKRDKEQNELADNGDNKQIETIVESNKHLHIGDPLDPSGPGAHNHKTESLSTKDHIFDEKLNRNSNTTLDLVNIHFAHTHPDNDDNEADKSGKENSGSDDEIGKTKIAIDESLPTGLESFPPKDNLEDVNSPSKSNKDNDLPINRQSKHNENRSQGNLLPQDSHSHGPVASELQKTDARPEAYLAVWASSTAPKNKTDSNENTNHEASLSTKRETVNESTDGLTGDNNTEPSTSQWFNDTRQDNNTADSHVTGNLTDGLSDIQNETEIKIASLKINTALNKQQMQSMNKIKQGNTSLFNNANNTNNTNLSDQTLGNNHGQINSKSASRNNGTPVEGKMEINVNNVKATPETADLKLLLPEIVERATSSRKAISQINNYQKVPDRAGAFNGIVATPDNNNSHKLSTKGMQLEINATRSTIKAPDNSQRYTNNQSTTQIKHTNQESSNRAISVDAKETNDFSLLKKGSSIHPNSSTEDAKTGDNMKQMNLNGNGLNSTTDAASQNLTDAVFIKNNVSSPQLANDRAKLQSNSTTKMLKIYKIDETLQNNHSSGIYINTTQTKKFKVELSVVTSNQSDSRTIRQEPEKRIQEPQKVSQIVVSPTKTNVTLNKSTPATNNTFQNSKGDGREASLQPQKKVVANTTTAGKHQDPLASLPVSQKVNVMSNQKQRSHTNNVKEIQRNASVNGSTSVNFTSVDSNKSHTNHTNNHQRGNIYLVSNLTNGSHGNENMKMSNKSAGLNVPRKLLSFAESEIHENKSSNTIDAVQKIENNSSLSGKASNAPASKLNITSIKINTTTVKLNKSPTVTDNIFKNGSEILNGSHNNPAENVKNVTDVNKVHHHSNATTVSSKLETFPESSRKEQNISINGKIQDTNKTQHTNNVHKNENRDPVVKITFNMKKNSSNPGTEGLAHNKTANSFHKNVDLQPEVMANEKAHQQRSQNQKLEPEILVKGDAADRGDFKIDDSSNKDGASSRINSKEDSDKSKTDGLGSNSKSQYNGNNRKIAYGSDDDGETDSQQFTNDQRNDNAKDRTENENSDSNTSNNNNSSSGKKNDIIDRKENIEENDTTDQDVVKKQHIHHPSAILDQDSSSDMNQKNSDLKDDTQLVKTDAKQINIIDNISSNQKATPIGKDISQDVDPSTATDAKSPAVDVESGFLQQKEADAKSDDVNDDVLRNGKAGNSSALRYSSSEASSDNIPEISPYKVQDFSLLKPTATKTTNNKDSNKNKSDKVKAKPPPAAAAANNLKNNGTEDIANGTSFRSEFPEGSSYGDGFGVPQRAQAAMSAVLTTHFGPTKDQMIPFDLELLDLADNYDNTTGMFICTIPGTYVISLYLMSHPGAKVNARVLINNRPIAALWADDAKNAGFYPSSSTQTIAQLAFGDQVYVMLVDGGYGDSWVHANYNVFTIFLLYEQMF